MNKYEPVIGLEVHAELMTAAKMFCGCRVVDSVEAEPNTAVCPVCLGMPGMLPVINKRAVEMAATVGLALNCEIQSHNVFARKNYFYPDLPKGYQITEFDFPIGRHGWLDIVTEAGVEKRIRIRRVHLEEDTGKLTHLDGGGSLVDYNRGGVPLLEIVSEPDIQSAEEALAYATKLRQLLRYLGVNSGDMEKGVIRFEANTSVRLVGATSFGTRTEVKNLNSFRALTGSISYEVERQSKLLDRGETVHQATMGWNENKRFTYTQRGKEDAHDYRYFPEPDLPPLQLDAAWIAQAANELPELPDAKQKRFRQNWDLPAYDTAVLTEERAVAEWFEAAVTAGADAKNAAKWIINELFRLMNEHKQAITEIQVTPAALVELLQLTSKKTINNNTAKEVLNEMFVSGKSAGAIVAQKGLAQISDSSAIRAIVVQVIADNPAHVAEYQGGKPQLIGWFMGQVMKASRGKANPEMVKKLLREALNV